MADCELSQTCIFFNDKMTKMPAMSGMFKDRYCRDDWAACARYRVFAKLGRPAVPTDLYPNERDRADKLLGF